jgi:hypothetical protein
VPTKTTDLTKNQGGCFNQQVDNTANSILTEDMDHQSVNNENPKDVFDCLTVLV